MDYIGEVGLFVDAVDVDEHVNPKAKRIGLPIFAFGGDFPDLKRVKDFSGILEAEDAHSRIAMAGFLEGLSIKETDDLFNGEHYRALGYFDRFDGDRRQLIERGAKFGVDITDVIEGWLGTNRFMYYPVHPGTRLFFDIIHTAMMAGGYSPESPTRLSPISARTSPTTWKLAFIGRFTPKRPNIMASMLGLELGGHLRPKRRVNQWALSKCLKPYLRFMKHIPKSATRWRLHWVAQHAVRG